MTGWTRSRTTRRPGWMIAELGVSAAGVITTSRSAPTGPADAGSDERVAGSSWLRFRFVPFPHPARGHHTGAEYL